MSLSSRRSTILERPLNRVVKHEINVATFALLFSEMVSYCQNRSATVNDLNTKLHEMGMTVGSKILDVSYIREKNYKREINLLHLLNFIKKNVWRSLFGKEADSLEQSNEDKQTYYIMEKEPLVNTFISVPSTMKNVHPASFIAGIIEAFLKGSNFNCQVAAHWHNGTAYLIKFDEQTIARATNQ